MKKVRVALGPRSYDVCIGQGILSQLGESLNSFPFDRKTVIVTHPRIERLHGRTVLKSLHQEGWHPHVFNLPAGERYKTLQMVSRIYDRLAKMRLERDSPLIALGGGVIGDMVGFTAATYLRGVPYIQVPTTLLAQVDSSVGGKTAVDHPLGKNLIGAFYQPKLVWIDIDFLKTLPLREFRAGLAEVVKYGIIADTEFFDFLGRHAEQILNREPDPIIHLIHRSCRIKADIVSRDERESGLRAILNYGHTFGHAIETLTKYKTFLHGEAVAIGMICAARLGHRLGFCDRSVADQAEWLLTKFGLPTQFPSLRFQDFYRVLQFDKKIVQEKSRFIIPLRIGKVRIQEVTDKKVLKETLHRC